MLFGYDYGKYAKRTVILSSIAGFMIGIVNFIAWAVHRYRCIEAENNDFLLKHRVNKKD